MTFIPCGLDSLSKAIGRAMAIRLEAEAMTSEHEDECSCDGCIYHEAQASERERCAKIAEAMLRPGEVTNRHSWAWERCKVAIAAKIRSGD